MRLTPKIVVGIVFFSVVGLVILAEWLGIIKIATTAAISN